MDCWVTPKEDFSVIVEIYWNRCKSGTVHEQVFECLPVSVDLYIIALRYGDD